MVLDPFVGSGTTLNVALQEGRDGIGFEVNETYVKNARDRIKKTMGKIKVPFALQSTLEGINS